MRRPFTRARHKAALAATTVALVAAGTAGAHAVPPRPAAAARIAAAPAAATDASATGAEPVTDAGQLAAAPTASLHPLALGPAGTRVVAVRFRPGVKAAAVAAALPLAASTRRFAATSRSVAPSTNAATYTVSSTTADAFIAAMKARADVADASYEVFAHYDARPNDPWFLTTPGNDHDQADYLSPISAVRAWDLRGPAAAAVKVAVVDSGVDVGHPDLSAKIAAGDRWNTFSNTANVTDTVGHGTFVAGIAAASTNNGIGIAGVGWDTKLMAVKVADAQGGLSLTDVAEGIRWAADHGAKVINLSLGATSGTTALADAVTYAQGLGALVVASAGNSAQEGNPKMYPAAYPGVVSVGATDAKGHRASFSENGSWVTMAAPGVRIRSTTVRAGSDFWPAGSYNLGDGTSFAAPIVAGTAALVWGRSPGATAAEVRTVVVASGTGYTGLGLGTGQVSMSKAMEKIVPSTAPTITAPAAGTTITGPVDLVATPHLGGVSVVWFLDGDPIPGRSTRGSPVVWDPRGWPVGAHTLEARQCTASAVCRDSGGDSIPVTVDGAAPTIEGVTDGGTVSGEVVIGTTGPVDWGLAVYEGSTRLSFSNVFPYSQAVNFTGLDGTHALQTVWCDSLGAHCDGARSPVVTVTSASADVNGGTVSEPVFSPDGDGVRDTTSIQYTTVGTQAVTVAVRREEDQQVVRTFPATSVAGGSHTLTWDGLDDAGLFAGNAHFTIRVLTTDGAGHQGLVSGRTRIDVTQPTVRIVTPIITSFYPVVDGVKDVFTANYTTSEALTTDLVVRNAAGTRVRTVQQSVPRGTKTSIDWDGKNDAGSLLPAGKYTWALTGTDAGGNTFTTTSRTVELSRKRLTTRTATVTKAGSAAYGVNAGPACAQVTTTGSSYAGGLWLKNTCAKGTFSSSAGFYHLTMPAAVRYTGYTIRTTGRSHSAPVDVMADLFSSQTGSYDTTWPIVRVPSGATTTRTLPLGRITTGGHAKTLDVVVFIPNDRLAPLTDWDLKNVSVTVTYQVLA